MDILVVPLLLLIKSLIEIAIIIVIVDVILSWFVTLNILNIHNRFVYTLIDTFSRISNFLLNPIRTRLPSTFGSFDLSPIVLLILLMFVEQVITRILLRFV